MQFNWEELSNYPESTQMAISQMWDEYKYRHTHIWRITFQITTAVVALSIVPYLNGSGSAGLLRFAPLVLAAALAFFMYRRVVREFELFDSVKEAYLRLSRQNVDEGNGHEFFQHTKSYILALAWGSVIHIFVIGLALANDTVYGLLGFGFYR